MTFDIQVVNIHDYIGEYVYVGRGSPLGNPFSQGSSKFAVVRVSNRAEAIEKYREWLTEQLQFDTPQARAFNECLAKLNREKKIVLGCFCKPSPCHAEVIAEMLKIMAEKSKLKWDEVFE